MTPAELTGQIDSHIVPLAEPACSLHRHAVIPFLRLRHAAAADGFDVVPVSAFRSFARQLAIWNAKFLGERPMLDAAGLPLDPKSLDAAARVAAILNWSALPGASRHHWGTDLDLIDKASVPPGYQVQLVAEEYAAGGMFAPLAAWLDANALRYGFFRPYRGVHSGVRAEAWHFSFAPLADGARRTLTPALLAQAIDAAPLQGKDVVLAQLAELHRRYVDAIDWP